MVTTSCILDDDIRRDWNKSQERNGYGCFRRIVTVDGVRVNSLLNCKGGIYITSSGEVDGAVKIGKSEWSNIQDRVNTADDYFLWKNVRIDIISVGNPSWWEAVIRLKLRQYRICGEIYVLSRENACQLVKSVIKGSLWLKYIDRVPVKKICRITIGGEVAVDIPSGGEWLVIASGTLDRCMVRIGDPLMIYRNFHVYNMSLVTHVDYIILPEARLQVGLLHAIKLSLGVENWIAKNVVVLGRIQVYNHIMQMITYWSQPSLPQSYRHVFARMLQFSKDRPGSMLAVKE